MSSNRRSQHVAGERSRADGSQSMLVIERLDPARDLDAVLAIQAASFTNPWTREMMMQDLERSDLTRAFVLRRDGEAPVGFCVCWLIIDELHIHTLAVHPDERRRGYARVLLEHVLREAIRAGARLATLEVRESNHAARGLYGAAGFVVQRRRPAYYENPAEDALVLWRDRLDAA